MIDFARAWREIAEAWRHFTEHPGECPHGERTPLVCAYCNRQLEETFK